MEKSTARHGRSKGKNDSNFDDRGGMHVKTRHAVSVGFSGDSRNMASLGKSHSTKLGSPTSDRLIHSKIKVRKGLPGFPYFVTLDYFHLPRMGMTLTSYSVMFRQQSGAIDPHDDRYPLPDNLLGWAQEFIKEIQRRETVRIGMNREAVRA